MSAAGAGGASTGQGAARVPPAGGRLGLARHRVAGAPWIDRTCKSFALAIVGAEYVLRVLPRGTHQWRRFVRPAELAAAASRAGLRQIDLRGMRYLPLWHRASWCRDTRVNHMATFARAAP